MIIKNSFARFCIGLHIILYSLYVNSDEFDYKFYWLSLPVAKLSINFNEPSTSNEINPSNVEFQLSTQGPLKLYRNYSSKGYIKYTYSDNSSWDYHLFGQDRGQPEKKLITYFSNSAPKIKKFIDDKGVSPISISFNLDKGAIDPFSILLKTMQQLITEDTCSNSYLVMDGKRRYIAKLTFIGKEYLILDKKRGLKGDMYHCQLRVLSNESKSSGVIKNYWPFNGDKKIVDMWFSEGMNYQPVKFVLNAPIGKIIGKLVTK